MNYTRILIAAFAGIIVFFALGYLGEGWLFRSHFAPYQGVYRSTEQMQTFMPIGMGGLLVAIFVLAMIYARWCGGAPGAGSGLLFGMMVGVFAACVHPISNLMTMNLGTKLGMEIAASTFVQWTAVGVVFGVIYRP
jgi:hypothetical protein